MSQYLIEYDGSEHSAVVRRLGERLFAVEIDGRLYEVDACPAEESVLSVLVDGANFEVHHSREGHSYTLLINGEHHQARARDRRVRSAFVSESGLLSGRQVVSAPMPGRVVRLLVEPGQAVQAGDALVTLEAMKMENQLRSPVAGSVLEISVAEGQTVATGERLLVVG